MTLRDADLPAAELEVLKALWELGPVTVRQVMNHLHQRDRKLAYTTVLTFLTRLEQRGYVRSDKSDLAYVYRAVATREKVTKSRLKSFLEDVYDGAAAPLVLQLVRDGKLSQQDIEELQSLIDELDAKPKRRKARTSKRSRK
ncbi:MAG: BlaI/MecI/CopY family transcriptional regulator [Phycisphaerales bacterium JB038]